MRKFALALSFYLFTAVFANSAEPQKDINFYLQTGMESMDKKNYKEAADSFSKACELLPGHPYLIFLTAKSYALAGNEKEGAKWLGKMVDFGFYGALRSDDPFADMLKDKEYALLAAKIKQLQQPVGKSEVAFTVPEKNLIAEGLAYDPTRQRFFAGSTYLRKILVIDKDGKYSNFTSSPAKLWQVLGMKVDSERGVLWAATTAFGPEMIDYVAEDLGKTGIAKLDLKTGQIQKTYFLDAEGGPRGFNDLDITRAGDIFITDSQGGSVCVLYHDSEKITEFLPAGSFRFPNGIALSDDQKHLFIAHSRGITVVEIANKKALLLPTPQNVTASGIDGLYFYKNTLVAVQNSYIPERIIQFELDRAFQTIQNATILAANQPAFNAPTTGAIADGYFYYIANSQLDSFDQDRKIFPPDKLQDLVILRVKLQG